MSKAYEHLLEIENKRLRDENEQLKAILSKEKVVDGNVCFSVDGDWLPIRKASEEELSVQKFRDKILKNEM